MKKIRMRNNMGLLCCLVAVLVFFVAPQNVSAANSQMDLSVGTTDNASAGDTVTVRLVGSNNPGISTFATRLAYDSADLEYVKTDWAKSITNDSSNIEMVSPVTENSQQVLNISAIFSSTYSRNETIATVTFKAKRAYTTMPVTLSVREVTDASYNPVTVAAVVDATAGETNNNASQTTEDTQDPENTEDVVINADDTETDDTASTGNKKNNKKNNSKKNNSSKPQKTTKNSSSTTSGSNNTDATPKTGAVDLRMVFGIAVLVFLGVSVACLRVLGKKKE